jgi:hypothetical protein
LGAAAIDEPRRTDANSGPALGASAGTEGAEVFAVMGFDTALAASKRPVTLAGVVKTPRTSTLPWVAITELLMPGSDAV